MCKNLGEKKRKGEKLAQQDVKIYFTALKIK